MVSESVHSGSCLCNSIHYEVRGAPLWVAHCHCNSCRHFSGAAVATYVGVRREQVVFTGVERQIYESSPGIRWGSCPNCGSSITYEADWCPGEVHILLGTLDNPGDFPPQKHAFYAERVAWLQLDEQLPHGS